MANSRVVFKEVSSTPSETMYRYETPRMNPFSTRPKPEGNVTFLRDGKSYLEKRSISPSRFFMSVFQARIPSSHVARLQPIRGLQGIELPLCLKWNPVECLRTLETIEMFVKEAKPRTFELRPLTKFFGTDEFSVYEWAEGNTLSSFRGKTASTIELPVWAKEIIEELKEITGRIEEERVAKHVDIRGSNTILRGFSKEGKPIITLIDQYIDGYEFFRHGYI